ncbi:hypothetical protein PENSUB_2288 [Penicillium subrubescens]|jgi:hypothetical protein|uniref:Uncharacterized protein n=1 Tax=Penicillium subrubescens TaxID=1316194 RepID=A0A1Q5UI10_9EURO|nr:hypothetical protein PENSUB_2288 [Penicillium subrubescens]
MYAVMHGTYTGQILKCQGMPRDQLNGIDLTPENTGEVRLNSLNLTKRTKDANATVEYPPN